MTEEKENVQESTTDMRSTFDVIDLNCLAVDQRNLILSEHNKYPLALLIRGDTEAKGLFSPYIHDLLTIERRLQLTRELLSEGYRFDDERGKRLLASLQESQGALQQTIALLSQLSGHA